MRDDQVRRYSRHILLKDVGGLGQSALLVSRARIELREGDRDAKLVAATFLAAGGVGTLAIHGATDAQLADLAARGADTTIVAGANASPSGDGAERALVVEPPPAWWPAADGDATALAFWRGGLAASRWMAAIVGR